VPFPARGPFSRVFGSGSFFTSPLDGPFPVPAGWTFQNFCQKMGRRSLLRNKFVELPHPLFCVVFPPRDLLFSPYPHQSPFFGFLKMPQGGIPSFGFWGEEGSFFLLDLGPPLFPRFLSPPLNPKKIFISGDFSYGLGVL